LRQSKELKQLLEQQAAQQKHIAAICAAPTILAAHGLLQGLQATAYPACKSEMLSLDASLDYKSQAIVEDGIITTSQGAGTAVDFALKLVEKLCCKSKADEIRQSIVAWV